jgi:hypothetical protein
MSFEYSLIRPIQKWGGGWNSKLKTENSELD